MEDIKITTAKKLAKQLTNLGFDFIIAHGQEVIASHGELKHEKPLPYGALSQHVYKYIADMKPGDVVHMPYGDLPPKRLARNVPACAHLIFGQGNYSTKTYPDYVEVLCLDRDDNDK
jgi:hypothetical protein